MAGTASSDTEAWKRCDECGVGFVRFLPLVPRDWHTFCSPRCKTRFHQRAWRIRQREKRLFTNLIEDGIVMRHLAPPKNCGLESCRGFLPITDELWLCKHASYGSASWRRGAVEEARRLMDRAGGYDRLMDAIEHERAERKRQAIDERERRKEQSLANVRRP